jgi:hypothetical protein
MFGWLFKNEKKKEYIGTKKMIVQSFNYWDISSEKRDVECACYKEFNPKTNEVYSVYATFQDKRYDFNPDVYVKEGRLISL